VDGLHRAAGSRHVLEVHGSIARVRCTGCRLVQERPGEDLEDLPHCRICGALLRPDVVWFNEMLPEDVWEEAVVAARQCHGFLVVGTSAVVYPAAGLVGIARAGGARVIEINLDPTPVSGQVDVSLYGPAGHVLPRLVERLRT
jgi:NAD-dependent deacetylase